MRRLENTDLWYVWSNYTDANINWNTFHRNFCKLKMILIWEGESLWWVCTSASVFCPVPPMGKITIACISILQHLLANNLENRCSGWEYTVGRGISLSAKLKGKLKFTISCGKYFFMSDYLKDRCSDWEYTVRRGISLSEELKDKLKLKIRGVFKILTKKGFIEKYTWKLWWSSEVLTKMEETITMMLL